VEIDDLEGADGFPGACEEYFLGKILTVLRCNTTILLYSP